MSEFLCMTVRFLLGTCHGRGEDGEPEWPPSPLRLFQALTAAAAARWNEREEIITAAPALRWLEQQSVVRIIAPPAAIAESSYRSFVPDNTADLAAGSWARGETTKLVKRTEKDIRRVYLPEGATVHYLYRLNGICPHFDELNQAARALSQFGWGIDSAIAEVRLLSAEQCTELSGEQWLPAITSDCTLRVPCAATFDNLARKHRAFLQRLGRDAKGNETFRPVPPLTAYRRIAFRRSNQLPAARVAAFALLRPDGSALRAFSQDRQASFVAERLRAATAAAAEHQWTPEQIAEFVLGHGEARGDQHRSVGAARFAYLPLPTLEYRQGKFARVSSIRRVMVACFEPAHAQKVRWAEIALAGNALNDGSHDGRELAWLEGLAPERSSTPALLASQFHLVHRHPHDLAGPESTRRETRCRG